MAALLSDQRPGQTRDHTPGIPEQEKQADGLALRLATVPEHSVPFMEAMSGGKAFCQGNYLFFSAEDWLMAVGYPLRGAYTHEDFEAALRAALLRTRATDCWAVGPDLPPRLKASEVDADRFYVLSARGEPPARLRRPLEKAAQVLRVEEGQSFTPAHRRLWAEFMGRTALKPNVRALFARTPDALGAPGTALRLLNAWDAEGQLAASLLMDYGPTSFCSYILGAHSRSRYTPHAADLLFAHMLESARKHGKRYIQLGLGVNEGIRRFKLKWGGKAARPYYMAAWQEARSGDLGLLRQGLASYFGLQGQASSAAPGPGQTDSASASQDDTLSQLRQLRTDISRWEFIASLPEQRPFAMLWELEKNGRRSWIGGTAHFFCYSFERAFRSLFAEADTILFEGPLDPETLAQVEHAGKTPDPDQTPLSTLLTEEEIRALERVVRGPEGPLYRFFNMEAPQRLDVRWYLAHTRPWCAMFSLWTAFLERRGWRQSVDLEAWRLGLEMGKTVLGMESLEEQLASLEAAPVPRILNHFRSCRNWERQIRQNVRSYLAGDLLGMVGTSTEFPTRTCTIIDDRDHRFRERMRPYIEAGRCVVFVGSAHMVNLRHMLREDGFRVRRVLPTWKHRLAARWRPDPEGF